MASNVFVSFDHDDQMQIGQLKLLKNSQTHPLEFVFPLREPAIDGLGRPVKYSPGDPRSKSIRDEITRKLERASKLVVLIGDQTANSAWVDWEINTFYEMKKAESGEETWNRIRGMSLKGCENAPIPYALGNKSTTVMPWDPERLDRWLGQHPDA